MITTTMARKTIIMIIIIIAWIIIVKLMTMIHIIVGISVIEALINFINERKSNADDMMITINGDIKYYIDSIMIFSI